MTGRGPLIAILAAFLVLGVLYSIVTPLFETPDEIWHFGFVRYIAEHHTLPVQSAQPDHRARQEASQPPLYYLPAGAAIAWIDMRDFDDLVRLNPYGGYPPLPGDRDNRSAFIHTDHEAFPWHGAALAIHVARLVTVLLGAAAVGLTYAIAREIFPAHSPVPLGATALVAFNPQFLFCAGGVGNDVPSAAFAALSLFWLARILRHGISTRRLVFLGLSLGLAALTKVSLLALLPLALLAMTKSRIPNATKERGSWSLGFGIWDFVAHWLWVIGIWALIAGWWYVRNWLLYGDWLGTQLQVQLSGSGFRQVPYSPGEFVRDLLQTWVTFWLTFGFENLNASPLVGTGLVVLLLVGLLGLPLFIRREPLDRAASAGLLVLSAWVVLIVGALVRWMALTPAAYGRLLFPAAPAIAILLTAGLSGWMPRRAQPGLLVAMGTGLAALALFVPFAWIIPVYARPPALTEGQVQAYIRPVNIDFGGRMRLLGYHLDRDAVQPGDLLRVTLIWQSLSSMAEDYTLFIHLFGRDRQPIGQRDSFPGSGTYPTSLWHPGEIIADTYRVPVWQVAIAPVALRIEVGLYDRRTGQSLPATDPNGAAIGTSPVIARLRLASPQAPASPAASQFTLGDAIALADFNLDTYEAHPGNTIRLSLDWHALATPAKDYTVFVHLVDPQGNLRGQVDRPPLGDDFPTSFWVPGDHVHDVYEVALAPDAPAGDYRILAGLYDPVTGERLPALAADGMRLPDDQIPLGKVTVRAP